MSNVGAHVMPDLTRYPLMLPRACGLTFTISACWMTVCEG